MIRHKVNKKGRLIVIFKEKYGINVKFDRQRPLDEQVEEAVNKIKERKGMSG